LHDCIDYQVAMRSFSVFN